MIVQNDHVGTHCDAVKHIRGPEAPGVEGIPLRTPVTLVPLATFTDANPGATVDDFTATIDWGDGTTSAGTIIAHGAAPNGVVFSVAGTHLYIEEGTYPIQVSIKDVGGSETFAVTQAVIADAPLTAATPPPLTVTERVPFTAAIVKFTDANPFATVKDFSATIDWGDGHTSPGSVVARADSTFAVTATHTYAEEGDHSAAVHIADSGGATTSAPVS